MGAQIRPNEFEIGHKADEYGREEWLDLEELGKEGEYDQNALI